jgi:hypothetical protein
MMIPPFRAEPQEELGMTWWLTLPAIKPVIASFNSDIGAINGKENVEFTTMNQGK